MCELERCTSVSSSRSFSGLSVTESLTERDRCLFSYGLGNWMVNFQNLSLSLPTDHE